MMDLNFRDSRKMARKVLLTTTFKNQQREIGAIEFKMEVVFKTA